MQVVEGIKDIINVHKGLVMGFGTEALLLKGY